MKLSRSNPPIETTRPNQANKHIFAKRLSAALISCMLLVGVTAPGSVHADEIWNHWKAAEALVAAGDQTAAVPHWVYLANHYADTGEWENAALFCGKLDAYYDAAGDYEQAIHYYELENQYWVNDGKDWGAAKIQRADQIRTTVELYRSDTDEAGLQAAAAPKQGGLAKFEPAYGTYLGMYSEQDPKVGNYFIKNKQVYGKRHAIYLAYSHWGLDFPKQYASRAKEAGGALQIAWEPNNGLHEVVDGDYLHQWAKDAKASGIPIFLRFASEMNGPWVPWNGNPQLHIEKFRIIHDVLAKEAPNVAMVWSPGDVPASSIDAYYPGDDYVDWVGVSLYIEPYENGDPSLPPVLATSAVERLNNLYDRYAWRKPIMMSETGVPHYSLSAQEDFTEWAELNLQRLYEIMPYKYPRLKAITYFNVNPKEDKPKNDYSLSDSDAIQAFYSKLIANPYLLSKVEQGTKPAGGVGYVSVIGHQVFKKKTTLVPFVKIPDVYIGKVEYVLNGKVFATQSDTPYRLELQAGDAPEGSVMEIRVYNKAGKQVISKTYGLSSQVSVRIDNQDQQFEQPPVIINGSTMAPLRAIFEAFDAKVDYDAATRSVTAIKGDTKVELTLDHAEVRKNGVTTTLEVPAQLVGNTTMAPVRFVGEAFGGKVTWDGISRTASMSRGN